MQRRSDPDDVGNGIERAHLVEMHSIQGQVVDPRLRLGKSAEARERSIADGCGEICSS